MNRIIKNFLSTGFANIVGQLSTFLITAYYANIIGAQSYGEVAFAQNIWLYFSMVVLFGIQTYGTILAATNKDKIKTYVSEIISFRFIVALLSFACIITVAFLVTLLTEQSNDFKMLLIVFGLSAFPMVFNIDWLYNGLEEMQHNAAYILMKSLIPCAIIFLFFKSKTNLTLIPLAMFIGLFFASVYHFVILYLKKRIVLKFYLSRKIIKTYFYAGLPFLASNLLAMVNGNIDKVIMGFTIDKTELGIYNAAYVFINFLISVSGLLFNPVFPSLIKAFNDGEKDKLRLITKNVSKIITMAVLPITIGGIILSKDIIQFFFKRDEFQRGYIPFCILLIYIFVLYIREIFAYQLNAYMMQKTYMKIVLASAGANFIFNLIFIPYYGMIGAAIITLATEFINLVFMRHYAGKVIATPVLKNLFNIFIPALVMGAWVYFLKYLNLHLIVNICSAIIIYFIMLFLFKQLSIDIVRSLIKSKGK